jgi:hypothetical protein
MDAIVFVLLAETLVIVGLSVYLWYGVQAEPEGTTRHWVVLFILVVAVIGFAVTLFFVPAGIG